MSCDNLAELNNRFGIAGHLSFQKGPGGLAMVEISNSKASANLFLQGAHLARWTPRRQQPVIWLSPKTQFSVGKPIRGGVPVCWPWFASHPDGLDFPFHGHARITDWEVAETAELDDGATYLVLRLPPSEATRAVWPHATPVEIRLTVGLTLEIELATQNLDSQAVVLGQALHSYFRVGDVRLVKIHGLENCAYIDKLANGERKQQNGPLSLDGETDRVYLNSSQECLIEDPVLSRRIHINKRGSNSTVIWNPWSEKASKTADLGPDSYLNMVCVESANAADDVVTLVPGAKHSLWVKYTVEEVD